MVRIGVEAPITGDQSVTGVGMVNGAQLAADAINSKGGINGRQVEIVPIDDAADPTEARAALDAGKGLVMVAGPLAALRDASDAGDGDGFGAAAAALTTRLFSTRRACASCGIPCS